MFSSVGGLGRSWRKRLNRVGDNTAPCGTPFVILCVLELVFLYWTCACLPDMKFVSHLLSLLCIVVFRIF